MQIYYIIFHTENLSLVPNTLIDYLCTDFVRLCILLLQFKNSPSYLQIPKLKIEMSFAALISSSLIREYVLSNMYIFHFHKKICLKKILFKKNSIRNP